MEAKELKIRYSASHANQFTKPEKEAKLLTEWSERAGMVAIGTRYQDGTYLIQFRETVPQLQTS